MVLRGPRLVVLFNLLSLHIYQPSAFAWCDGILLKGVVTAVADAGNAVIELYL